MTPRSTVLLADDHRMVAESIANVLSSEFYVLPLVCDSSRLVEDVLSHRPDIVVSDISMGKVSGVDAMRMVKAAGADIPFLFLSMHQEPAIVAKAIRAGARGYIFKSAAARELVQAIREVLSGGAYISPSLLCTVLSQPEPPRITPRQLLVLECIARGQRSREIALKLSVSLKTVEAHRYALMQAFKVRNSIELLEAAAATGIITPK